MHPYHITYLSNLLPILEKEALYSKNLLEKEGIGHRDPTYDLIESENEKQTYLNSERIDEILKIETDQLRELDCRDSLGNYIRLYFLNSDILPPYAYRFILNTMRKHEGIVFLVFKPIKELLNDLENYIMIFGSAFSKYRKVCADLNTFVRVALFDLIPNLKNYVTDLMSGGLGDREIRSEVSQWFLHSEIDLLNCLPLQNLEFIVAFSFDNPESILSYPKIMEASTYEFLEYIRGKPGYRERVCYYIANKKTFKLESYGSPGNYIFDDFCSAYLSVLGVSYPERKRFKEVTKDFKTFRVITSDTKSYGVFHQLEAEAESEDLAKLIAEYTKELLALFNGSYLYLW